MRKVNVIIRAIESINEIRKIASVEAETWGMQPENTVPDHVLAAVARDGGVLLGAYDQDDLIGYTLGWLGTVSEDGHLPANQRLKLVSHMTGVLSTYRDRGVGYQLKLAQREWALNQGLDLITWTYDPLESRNGYFNIHLLGSVCGTYLRDYYGDMVDEMNQGVYSDRFRVDWWIDHPDVANRLSTGPEQNQEPISIAEIIDQGANLAYEPRLRAPGTIIPPDDFEIVDSDRVLVEIPPDFQEIRQQDLELALSWRVLTREVFEKYFSLGFKVVDFFYQRPPDPRSFYILGK